MVGNRPFDFSLTGKKFNPEVRVGIVCPGRDGLALSRYLTALHNTKMPDSKDEYLLAYPGFAQAFGLPLDLPKQGDRGWMEVSEPSANVSPSSGATEVARNLTAAVRALRASSNPDVVLIYVPTRWKAWERFESESETFDLHNFVKAYCVQNGATSQLSRSHISAKSFGGWRFLFTSRRCEHLGFLKLWSGTVRMSV